MTGDRNVERAARLDTATLSDALDRLGIIGQCKGIGGRDPGFRWSAAPSRSSTVRRATPSGTVGDYIDDVAAGEVMVLDNGGREDVTVWGDILTEIAHRRGHRRHGDRRHLPRRRAAAATLGYPVFARGHWMRTGKDRVQVEAHRTSPSRSATRACRRGRPHESATPTACSSCRARMRMRSSMPPKRSTAVEEAIRAAVRGGQRLDEARTSFRYHSLQTRKDAQ